MTPKQIEEERRQIAERYGDWTDHNIRLADGVYTLSPDRQSVKLRRILQVVADVTRRNLSELRILDLACLEGQYAIEFALHGAEVVAIEGREANAQKALFAKRVLGLDRLTVCQDDVRNLSLEKYGEFDVVLCLGILYHLDAPDVFDFVTRMASVCRHVLVMDTFVSIAYEKSFEYQGNRFWGRSIIEHDPASEPEERLSSLWASLDNIQSLWLTRESVFNLLTLNGFTSAYECRVPVEPGKYGDRVTLVGLKGTPQTIHSIPAMNGQPPDLIAEPYQPAISPRQQKHAELKKRLTLMIPRRLRRAIKKALGRSAA